MISSTRVACAVLGLWSAAGLLTPGAAQAQTATDYPNRPIRMIVPFPPGGGTDVLARLVAQRLQDSWGQSVVIENQPGASGGIGTSTVARAAPDGATLLMASTGALMAAAGTLGGEGSFDAGKHFAPVTLVAAPPYIVTVGGKAAMSSIADLIRLAKQKPGALTFGSSGVGAASHLTGELFQKQAGIDILHVPYKGTGQAVTDLIGGRIDIMFAPPQTVQPLVASGELRALATTGTVRSPLFPDLPTVAEAGLPGFSAVGWFGLLAPYGTPKPIVDKLNGEVVAMLSGEEMRARLAALGAAPQPQTPAEFTRFINDDVATWTVVLREAERKAGR